MCHVMSVYNLPKVMHIFMRLFMVPQNNRQCGGLLIEELEYPLCRSKDMLSFQPTPVGRISEMVR